MRVYYQDTDAGGVVFHATYLHFFERARMEWMRDRGFDARELAAKFGLVFIVRQLEVAYLKPALLDDLVMVSADVQEMGRAQLTFAQEVRRDGGSEREVLVRASINVACVLAHSLKPAPFPEPIRASLTDAAQPTGEKISRSVQPRGDASRV